MVPFLGPDRTVRNWLFLMSEPISELATLFTAVCLQRRTWVRVKNISTAMCFASLSASVLPGQSFTFGCLNNRAGTWYQPPLPVNLAERSPFPWWHLLQHHAANRWRLFAESDWKRKCRRGYNLHQRANSSQIASNVTEVRPCCSTNEC